MVQVKLYTWSYCPFCQNAKKLLEEKGIDYEEIVLDNKEEELQELRQQTNQRTVPQIFVNGTFIGGYSELVEFFESGEFDKV